MIPLKLREALRDLRGYMSDQPIKADTWTIGDASTPYIGSLRLLLADWNCLRRENAKLQRIARDNYDAYVGAVARPANQRLGKESNE